MPDLPDRPLLRVDEVAQHWSVSRQTIYLWIEHGHLKIERTPSGLIRITRESALACKLIKHTNGANLSDLTELTDLTES